MSPVKLGLATLMATRWFLRSGVAELLVMRECAGTGDGGGGDAECAAAAVQREGAVEGDAAAEGGGACAADSKNGQRVAAAAALDGDRVGKRAVVALECGVRAAGGVTEQDARAAEGL